MKKNNTISIFLILCILTLFCLTGCNNKTNSEDIKSKISQEIDYLDSKIISMLNRLNNISLQNYTITSEEITLGESSGKSSGESSGGEQSGGGSSSQGETGGSSSGGSSGGQQEQSNSQSQSSNDTQKNNITTTKIEPETVLESDENDIDWTSIKNEIEMINESWSVVILDLSTLNVDNNDILNFSNTLDNCIVSIKDENKADSLANIAALYSFIPRFERTISAGNGEQNVKEVKSYLINAYSIVEHEDWTAVESNISECEQTFKNILNDIEYMKDKEYKINKTYILIKELQNSLSNKDKKLFYVKYRNLMDNINTL